MTTVRGLAASGVPALGDQKRAGPPAKNQASPRRMNPSLNRSRQLS